MLCIQKHYHHLKVYYAILRDILAKIREYVTCRNINLLD